MPTIAMAARKDYLGKYLFEPIGVKKRLLRDDELNGIFKLFWPFKSKVMKNNMTSFKRIGKTEVIVELQLWKALANRSMCKRISS